ncbi:MAG: hypothetical protein GX111_02940 [Clostridiales bacterium]|nr:hypothetical protein [Clostridiales bacterium]
MRESVLWYHGSPFMLTSLREGSTVTRNRDLARVFSHKPLCVLMEDDGRLRHNGSAGGYLYVVDEAIGDRDVYPHPATTMDKELEWLTKRELRVKLIGQTDVRDEERLSENEIRALIRTYDQTQ